MRAHRLAGFMERFRMNKNVLTSFTILCLLSTVFPMGSAFNVQIVKASGTITIRVDGSIDPPTANVTTVDNVTYTFTGNIYDEIAVERSNIIIDGNGYTLSGSGVFPAPPGINLTSMSNVTIENIIIRRHWYAILLSESSNNIISGNTVTSCGGILLNGSSNRNSILRNKITGNSGYGIFLEESSNNSISGNNITSNLGGIALKGSSNENGIYRNNITDNAYGIVLEEFSNNNVISKNIVAESDYNVWLDKSSSNKFCHNNFINGTVQQVYFQVPGYANVWDNGYPSVGNYWSDYGGVDVKSGSGQDELGSDGVGDTAHVFDADNNDSYPLMAPIRTFNAGTWNEVTYYVDISSNSTISDFTFSQADKRISFNATGINGTSSFCRVVIPKELLWVEDGWIIFVGWTQIGPWVTEDANNTYLYFMYSHSTKEVQIRGTDVIPEFPSLLILPLFIIATLLAVILYRREYSKSVIS